MFRLFFFLILSLFASLPGYCQKWTIELDKALRILDRDGFFDGQVLIAEQGEIMYAKPFGTTTRGEEIKGKTALNVNSLSKSFTAVAILQLMEQGKLTLDDPVTKFFPNFPYTRVTIQHLLHMTSGLPRVLELALNEADTNQILTNRDAIDLLVQHRPAAGIPGQSFHYNNTNYFILASIVEQVSGQSFDQYLEKYIFEPTGMNQSYESVPRIFTSLRKKGIHADNFLQASGAGSVFTTAYDLYLYDQALYTEQLLSTSSKAILFSVPDLPQGRTSNYACGWQVEKEALGSVYYHVGDGRGMRASIQRFVDQRKTLIYLHQNSNIYHEAVYAIVRNIWEGKPYELPKRRNSYQIDPSLYLKYIGTYESKFGIVHISTENNKLYVRPDAIPGKEELIPSSDTTFYFSDQNMEWEFFLDDKGSVIGFGIKGDQKNMGIPKK